MSNHADLNRKSKRRRQITATAFVAWVCAFALTSLAASEKKTDGDRPFTGDRRPGILEPPSDIPTGDNAALYDFLNDSLTEDSVKTSSSSAVEAPLTEAPLIDGSDAKTPSN